MFDEKFVFGVIGGCIAITFMAPEYTMYAMMGMSGYLGFYWWTAQRTGAIKLMDPGNIGRTLMLWFDKYGRISIQYVTPKAEGYLALKKFGVVKQTKGSNYLFEGKRCMIGMEGIAHTIDVRYVKLTEQLTKEGYRLERDTNQEKTGKAQEESTAENPRNLEHFTIPSNR